MNSNIFSLYDLKRIGLACGTGPMAITRGQLVVLETILQQKDKHVPKRELFQMINEVFDVPYVEKDFAIAVFNLPSVFNTYKLTAGELVDICKKFMNKWIAGDSSNCNYFIRDYRSLFAAFHRGKFFKTANVAAQKAMKLEWHKALVRQISSLCDKKDLEVGLETWKQSSYFVKDLFGLQRTPYILLSEKSSNAESSVLFNTKQEEVDFVEKFYISYAETTILRINIAKQCYQTDAFKSYFNVSSQQFFRDGYFDVKSAVKVDLQNFLENKKAEILKTIDNVTSSFEKTSLVRKDVLEWREKQQVDFHELISVLNTKIIEFGKNQVHAEV